MTSSNFMDTAPANVTETQDPDTVVNWINQLPLPERAGKVLLFEWAARNNIKLTAAHYDRIRNPMGELLRANLSEVSKP